MILVLVLSLIVIGVCLGGDRSFEDSVARDAVDVAEASNSSEDWALAEDARLDK